MRASQMSSDGARARETPPPPAGCGCESPAHDGASAHVHGMMPPPPRGSEDTHGHGHRQKKRGGEEPIDPNKWDEICIGFWRQNFGRRVRGVPGQCIGIQVLMLHNKRVDSDEPAMSDATGVRLVITTGDDDGGAEHYDDIGDSGTKSTDNRVGDKVPVAPPVSVASPNTVIAEDARVTHEAKQQSQQGVDVAPTESTTGNERPRNPFENRPPKPLFPPTLTPSPGDASKDAEDSAQFPPPPSLTREEAQARFERTLAGRLLKKLREESEKPSILTDAHRQEEVAKSLRATWDAQLEFTKKLSNKIVSLDVLTNTTTFVSHTVGSKAREINEWLSRRFGGRSGRPPPPPEP
eukprot:Opistho-2@38550